MRMFTLRLEADEDDAARDRAAAEGVSKNELVKRALRAYCGLEGERPLTDRVADLEAAVEQLKGAMG